MNNTTELVFILDKSGSMAGMEKDTIGGFNAMLAKQKECQGKAFVSTVLFSNSSVVIHDRMPLEQVPQMTGSDYVVGGMTALLDAVGDAINHVKNIHRYIRAEDVPQSTVFVITTDGMENCSTKYSHKQIKEMIKEQQEKHGWEFVFLAANIDAGEVAESIGVGREHAVNYNVAEETDEMYEAVSEAICAYRQSPTRKMRCGSKIERDIKSKKSKKK